MVSKTKLDPTTNPIDLLDNTLEQSWETLCAAYEVDTELPNAQNLFARAAIKTPPKAAETVLVNMLTEVIENVGRFSPWYKQPARAFGLISLRDPVTGQSRWLLAPEALLRWGELLQNLTQAIKRNNGLIQATLLVENLAEEELDDPQVIAQCDCYPPKRIQINLSILDKTAIICDECQHPFVS
jgi:hypothetical protein